MLNKDHLAPSFVVCVICNSIKLINSLLLFWFIIQLQCVRTSPCLISFSSVSFLLWPQSPPLFFLCHHFLRYQRLKDSPVSYFLSFLIFPSLRSTSFTLIPNVFFFTFPFLFAFSAFFPFQESFSRVIFSAWVQPNATVWIGLCFTVQMDNDLNHMAKATQDLLKEQKWDVL